jgi:hypothetical protein
VNRGERFRGYPLAVLAAVVVALFSAAASLDPGAQGAYFTESASYLTLSTLVICIARAVSSTTGALRLIGGCLRLSGLTCLLSLPALTAAWEVGADSGQLVGAAFSVVAATLCGALLGRLAASLGMSALPGVIASLCIGALMLWPATLGRFHGIEPCFPRPESSTVAVVLLMIAAAASWALPVFRRRSGIAE